MPVPYYDALMQPLLEELADGKEHPVQAVRERVAVRVGLSESDWAEMLPSGKQPLFDNRIGWAKTYLDRAGLVRSVKRGAWNGKAFGRRGQCNSAGKVGDGVSTTTCCA